MQEDTAQLLPNSCTMQAPWAAENSSYPRASTSRSQKSFADSSSVFTDSSAPVMSFPGLSVRTSCCDLLQGISSSAPAGLERETEGDLEKQSQTDSTESLIGATSARGRAGSATRPILRSESSVGMHFSHLNYALLKFMVVAVSLNAVAQQRNFEDCLGYNCGCSQFSDSLQVLRRRRVMGRGSRSKSRCMRVRMSHTSTLGLIVQTKGCRPSWTCSRHAVLLSVKLLIQTYQSCER